MTRKTLYLLNINDYAPELTALTYPFIHRYADKIGAKVEVIDNRVYPDWDLDYEKFQIWDRAQSNGDDWSIYIDSDALLHPEIPDLTEIIPPDTVGNNKADFANVRFAYDDYFRRDGRHIGLGSWLVICPRMCLDLWRPLDDITYEECVSRISLSVGEKNSGLFEPHHLITDFGLSRNLARFGLKLVELHLLWKELGFPNPPAFFHHEYTIPLDAKVEHCQEMIDRWQLNGPPKSVDVGA